MSDYLPQFRESLKKIPEAQAFMMQLDDLNQNVVAFTDPELGELFRVIFYLRPSDKAIEQISATFDADFASDAKINLLFREVTAAVVELCDIGFTADDVLRIYEEPYGDLCGDGIPVPFIGILISVVLYAIGSGLIEVLVSPIVEACPFENKEGTMSLLHSFYCWGAMAVILGSTVFFAVFGIENWKILTFVWALVPLYNTLNFVNCPIERLVEDGKSMGIRGLLKPPIFWLMIVLMVCSGASEATMSQWASAFTESAIGVSKAIGDLAGPCLFAMFMGISRMLYGKFSEKLDLSKVMLVCGIMCAGCYLLRQRCFRSCWLLD